MKQTAQVESNHRAFAADLRRVLYFAHLYTLALDWLTVSEVCPSFIKANANNARNSMNRFAADVRHKATPEAWAAVNHDLSREQMYDLCELVDLLAEVDNMEEVLEAVKSARVPKEVAP